MPLCSAFCLHPQLVSQSWEGQLAAYCCPEVSALVLSLVEWEGEGWKGYKHEGCEGLCRGDSLLNIPDRVFGFLLAVLRVRKTLMLLRLWTCAHFSNTGDKSHLSAFTASPPSAKKRQDCLNDFTFLWYWLMDGRLHAVRLPFRKLGKAIVEY